MPGMPKVYVNTVQFKWLMSCLLMIANAIVPHFKQEKNWIELRSEAKTHGIIYAALGGGHLTSNDVFKGITLKQCRVMQENVGKEKKCIELNALDIIANRGGILRNSLQET